MGCLVCKESGQELLLRARVLIGRSALCGLVIDDLGISAEHAVLAWTFRGWCVKDLASTNRTAVNDRVQSPGVKRRLEKGDSIGFGGVSTWELIDGAAPGLFATRGDRVVRGRDALLLPDSRHPEVCIARTSTSAWEVEHIESQEHRKVDDGELVVVSGEIWRLSVPVWDPPSLDLEDLEELADAEVFLQRQRASLTLRVGRHNEVTGAWIGEKDVGSGAHLRVLLPLARRWIEQSHWPADARGWVSFEELLDGLEGVTRSYLHVMLSRCRDSFEGKATAGILESLRGRGVRLDVGQVRIEKVER